MSDSCDTMDGLYPARLLCPLDFPGRNTGVGHHGVCVKTNTTLCDRKYRESGMSCTSVSNQAPSLSISDISGKSSDISESRFFGMN